MGGDRAEQYLLDFYMTSVMNPGLRVVCLEPADDNQLCLLHSGFQRQWMLLLRNTIDWQSHRNAEHEV